MYTAEIVGSESRTMTVAVYQGHKAEEVSPDKDARTFSLLTTAIGMATARRKVRIDSVIRLGSFFGVPSSC